MAVCDIRECLAEFVRQVARDVAKEEAERALLLAEGYCPMCRRRLEKAEEDREDWGGTFLVYRCPEHGLVLAIRVEG